MNFSHAMNFDVAHAELADLAERYRKLPPKRVRWKTTVGRVFLDDLEDLILDFEYPIHMIAKAFGITPQAIAYMRRCGRKEHRQWPDDSELLEFRAAWALVENRHARYQQVRRSTPEFDAVHEALVTLLRFYEMHVLGTALGIRPSLLYRYLGGPTGG